MNQITPGGLTAVESADRPSQRAQAKQRTRDKVLAAAKALFAERGYEASTIRDIARAAGMSTGAVFASFTDKSDLFTEIAEAEQAELYVAMRAAASGTSGEAAILAMLEAATERQSISLAMVQAVVSTLQAPGLAERARRRLDRRPISGLVAAAVRQALDGADGADTAFVAEMIWDGYLAVLRRAAQGGLTGEAAKARIAGLVRTILAGARLSA